MYDDGADIVYHAAGKSGLGVFDAAAAAGDGKWAIGVDSDQYLTAAEDQKPHILTSMLKRVDVAVFDYVKAFDDEPVKPGFVDLRPEGRRCRLLHVAVASSTTSPTSSTTTGTKIMSGEIDGPDRPCEGRVVRTDLAGPAVQTGARGTR